MILRHLMSHNCLIIQCLTLSWTKARMTPVFLRHKKRAILSYGKTVMKTPFWASFLCLSLFGSLTTKNRWNCPLKKISFSHKLVNKRCTNTLSEVKKQWEKPAKLALPTTLTFCVHWTILHADFLTATEAKHRTTLTEKP